MKSILKCLPILLGMLASSGAFATNIAVNPGFEIAGIDHQIAEGWNSSGGPVGEAFRTNALAHTGDWSFYLLSGPADNVTAVASLSQSGFPSGVNLASLEENTDVSVSFWTNHNLGTGEAGRANIRIINSRGSHVGDVSGVALRDFSGRWIEQNIPPLTVPAFGPAPNDEYYLILEFSVSTDNDIQNSFIEAYIDDVVINATLVPEPTSVVWLGAFLGIVIGHRQDRRLRR